MFREFIPKSFLSLRHGYSLSSFKKDLLAGITIGIIALPLAMAFAIASGTSPERGLATAIIAGFLISALGGSRVQIGGPTGAFVVIVYDVIQRTGYEGLALATLFASILLVVAGFFRLGSYIKFVPQPLIVGFTAGLAVLIFSSQVKDFLGLQMAAVPPHFLEKWIAYGKSLPTIHFPTVCLGMATFALIVLLRRFAPKIPWGIASIVLATLMTLMLGLPVETIETKFGQIPNHLPWPALPCFSCNNWTELFSDAIAIAFLAGVESLLSAVVGDGMTGSRHRPNCELVAQGVANFGSVLFGGIPATGAIARTAANAKMGAQTPLAGMMHAATLFLIVLFFSPLVSQIPLAALAAVLMMVAWNMAEANHFLHLFRAPRGDVAILLTAFLLTVFVDLTVAISCGMVLASLIFMKNMSHVSKTVVRPEGVNIYEIQGPLFFGAADLLKDIYVQEEGKVFVLQMHHVPMIDASGMHALKEFHKKCLRQNAELHLSGVSEKVKESLRKFGLQNLYERG